MRGEGELETFVRKTLKDGQVDRSLGAKNVRALGYAVNEYDVKGEVTELVVSDRKVFLEVVLVLVGDFMKHLHGALDFGLVHIVGQPQVQNHLSRGFGGDVFDRSVGDLGIRDGYHAPVQRL